MKKLLLAFSLGVAFYCSFAQSTANYTFTTNSTGSLVLGANGNTIDRNTSTTAVLANNTSQGQSINAVATTFPSPFEFYVGAKALASSFASSNGLVQLASPAAITATAYGVAGGTAEVSNTIIQATNAGVLSGIKTIGTGGDYDNLTTAFADINSLGLSGDIELQLVAGYPAAAETYPIVSSTESAVATYHVKVYPAVSGLSITSADETGTLNLDNAFNITIDGRVNQTGANDLVIANTNAGASYAVQFVNDARNNTLSHLILESANTSATSGTVVIGTTVNANGNDNNTIDNCAIKDGATTPANAIYSVGTTTTAVQYNDSITISNNTICNFFNAASATAGVVAAAGTNAWVISNNKIYQTATRTYTAASIHNGILVNNAAGNGFIITGNTIGFADSTGTGVYTMAGTAATRFVGINILAGTTTASSIQGNTVAGISLTTSDATNTDNGIFAGINITGGNVDAGNITPNIIGAATGTGAITTTASASGGLIVGINSSSAGTVNISNNSIGSITANGSPVSIFASITGIQVSAGTPTINENIIGSATTANSINSPSITTAGSQFIRGIDVSAGVSAAASIQSNTIANLNQNARSSGSSIRGIAYAGTGLATISFNTIYNLSGANVTSSVTGAASGVEGILHNGFSPAGAVINKNTIYALSSTTTVAAQTNVVGIGYSNPTSGSITNNTIYGLRNTSTSGSATTPPTASGILLRSFSTAVQISNNMISLGNAQTNNTEFIGIWNSVSTSGVINVYHNSVSISGTATSGALASFGLLRGDNSTIAITTKVNIRNNIFSNTRSGGAGKHYAIGNKAAIGSTSGWTPTASNYNVLNASTATIGLWGAIDETFAAWKTASSGDANSISAIPVVFAGIPAGNLHLNMGTTVTLLESGGTTIATVTTDIDNQPRPGPSGSVNFGGTAPDLGADEFDGRPVDVVPPLITYTILSDTATTANRPTLSFATITDQSGVNIIAGTRPRLYYKKSGDANDETGWKYVESSGTATPFDFTIDYSLLNAGSASLGNVIQYFVVAQDNAATPHAGTNSGSFAAAPSSVALTSAAFPIGGTINSYTIIGVLPVSITSLKAFVKNSGVQVEWKTENETGMAAYEVEKSTGASTFTKSAKVTATGASAYHWYDASPINGTNYYRIKLVDKDGAFKYTQVANVKITDAGNIFTIVGNPIKNKTITLQLKNVDKGTYTVTVFNSLGKAIATKAINHAGGNATEAISLGNAAAAGAYQLSIIGSHIKDTKSIIVE